MIQITPQMRVLVAVEPADFRRGIDGLARECRAVLRSDPFSGTVFVFRNRRATAVKILVYDGQGFWLCYNQLASHCTSSRHSGASCRTVAPSGASRRPAARSTSRSQRLE